MMQPLHKGLLATFFGVLVGSFTAIALNRFWFNGAIVGGIAAAGITAYLSFDIRAVGDAFRTAWQKMAPIRLSPGIVLLSKFLGAYIGTMAVITILWSPIVYFVEPSESLPTSLFLTFMAMFLVGSFTMMILDLGPMDNKPRYIGNKSIAVKDFLLLVYFLSPAIILIMLWNAPRFLAWGAKTVAPVVWKFCKIVFIEIHCRDRAMCLVDSSVGMIVAFTVQQQFIGGGSLLSIGSILVGGLTGTVLYFFNREVVAIRWLKIQPNGTHT